MGIISSASGSSCWRGLDYYKNKKIKNINIINDSTQIYATHISHEGNGTHNEMREIAKSLGYDIAYDGIMIEV